MNQPLGLWFEVQRAGRIYEQLKEMSEEGFRPSEAFDKGRWNEKELKLADQIQEIRREQT